MPKSRLVLAALVAQAAAASIVSPPKSVPDLTSLECSILPKCLGDLPTYDHPHPDGQTKKPPSLIIGVVVDPTRKADPRDPNCPSGRCIIVDPKEICDGTQPNCLPFANIRQPSLPCKKKLPKCPSGGLLIDPEISCHVLDTKCPGGGVYVYTPPGTNSLPPWIEPCTQGTKDCPNDHQVVNVPKWPPANDKPIPGVPFDRTKICTATTPGCEDGGIVVPWEPSDECDARVPGCLAIDIPSNPPDGTGDPACPPPIGHVCRIINPQACHPNQPTPPAGCMKVDPIPCLLGSPGCNTGKKIPPPVQDCVPLSNGCSKDGTRLPHPPSNDRDITHMPPGDQALIVDPKGKIKCSFKSVAIVAPLPAETVTVLSPPQTVTAACPSSKLPSPKPTPPASPSSKKPVKSSTKPAPTLPEGEEHYGPTTFSIPTSAPSFSSPATPKITEDVEIETLTKKNTKTKTITPPVASPPSSRTPEFVEDVEIETLTKRNTKTRTITPPVASPPPSQTPEFVEDVEIETLTKKNTKTRTIAPPVASPPPSQTPEYVEDVEIETLTKKNTKTRTITPPVASPPSQTPEYVEDVEIETLTKRSTKTKTISPSLAATPPRQHPKTIERVITQTVTESSTKTVIPSPGTPETIKHTVTETITHSTTDTPKSKPPASAQAAPLSKFACSTSDTSPCIGGTTTPWTLFYNYHAAGSTANPTAYNTVIHNPENTDIILTVTDNIRKWELFTVSLDGQVLGQTSVVPLNWFADCGTDADNCIAQGWSHGYFKIPPGTHNLSIEWTGGGYWGQRAPPPDNRWMTDGVGQWRLSKSCTC